MLASSTILVQPAFVDRCIFARAGLTVVDVDPSEPHSANVVSFVTRDATSGASVRTIIVPAEYPKLHEKLESFLANRVGHRMVKVDMSELAKAEGAVTCCSLLFYTERTDTSSA